MIHNTVGVCTNCGSENLTTDPAKPCYVICEDCKAEFIHPGC